MAFISGGADAVFSTPSIFCAEKSGPIFDVIVQNPRFSLPLARIGYHFRSDASNVLSPA